MATLIDLSFEGDLGVSSNGTNPTDVIIDDVSFMPTAPPRNSQNRNLVEEKRVSWADGNPTKEKFEKPGDIFRIEKKSNDITPIVYDVDNDDDGNTIPEISDLWWNMIDDGKDNKVPETDFEKLQYKVRHFIDHISVRAVGIILILLDIILMIIDISIAEKSDGSQGFFDGIALTLSCLFMVDMFLRLFSYGFQRFFCDPWEVIDSAIVVITFGVTLFYTILDQYADELDSQGLGRLVLFARFIRIIRVVRLFYSHEQLKKSSRRTVSQNKRRYKKDGFDLDLTYVTDRVIAMSFPSKGTTSIFRNPIDEVSRFFKTKHPGKFRIYNLCSERAYDERKFENRVYRVMIDDHNVPSLVDLIEFINDVRAWMARDDEHVIAVHCKGGKGRTGTCISSWLIENGKFEKSKDALEYFGSRRTDLEVGETFQGVETASQIRYVGYYEQIKSKFDGKIPPHQVLRLKSLIIHSIAGVGRGNGSDLSLQIIVDGKELHMCKFAEEYNGKVRHNSEKNHIVCEVGSCPDLVGDIKFRFTSTDKTLPCGYDNCPFYFWIHTSFVENNQMILSRDQIDNPHKKKTWHIFQEDFAVELLFGQS